MEKVLRGQALLDAIWAEADKRKKQEGTMQEVAAPTTASGQAEQSANPAVIQPQTGGLLRGQALLDAIWAEADKRKKQEETPRKENLSALPGIPGTSQPIKNDSQGKMVPHKKPVDPMSGMTAIDFQFKKQTSPALSGDAPAAGQSTGTALQQPDPVKELEEKKKYYDYVIEQLDADSERLTELWLFYDNYSKNSAQWKDDNGELTEIAKKNLAEYDAMLKKWGVQDLGDSIPFLRERLEAERDRIAADSVMKKDMAEFETWPEKDQAVMYDLIRKTAFGVTTFYGLRERKYLNDLYGKEKVDNIRESVTRYQNAQKKEQVEGYGKADAGFVGTALSIPAGWVGAANAMPGQVIGSFTGTGRYPTADPYTAGTELSIWAESVQSTTAENVKQDTIDAIKAMGFSKQTQEAVGSFMAGTYQVGVGIAENLTRALTFGGTGALTFAGVGSFSTTYRQATENGASDAQAMAMGLVAGFLEVGTEKIPLDNLLDDIAKAGKLSGGGILKNALAQGGVEATTEEINYLGNVLAQAVVLRESSDYNVMIRSAMANGVSYAEAVKLADQQIIMQAGQTAAMAYFQGAGSSAIGSVIGKLAQGNVFQQKAQPQQNGTQQESQTVGNGTVQAEDLQQQAQPQQNGTQQESQTVENGTVQAEDLQQQAEKLSYAEKIRRAENNNNGGNTNEAARTQYAAAQPGAGNGVSDGGSQRAAGMGTGEQAGSVAGRTGQTAQRSVPKNAGAAGFDRQNRAQRLRKQGLIQPVSSKSLGLNKGTDAQNLLVLPESEYDAELREVSQRIKAETGKDVTFVVGAIQIRTPAGNQKVRGARTPDGIIVQADNLKATATQIADHEAYHDKIRAPGGLGLGWSVRNHITENYSEEEFQQIVGKYLDAMAGTMEIQNAEDQERFLRRVEEEVLADAYAGIDYRGYGATKFTGAVNEAMDQKGAGKLRQQENGVRQTNAPPSGQNENTVGDDGEWYSLDDVAIPTREELENKPPVAVVDISQAQTKGTFAQRRKQILENAPQVISKPYLNKDTGVMIFLTEHSYTHAFNNIGEIQLNAAEHIPEFIENAVLTHAEGNTHGSDYATGVYTFFAAAKAERVRPVKLKVKEYRYSGQELPRNIKAYFENHPQGYAASYDTVVLEVEEIEESPAGSAKDMNPMDPFQGPAELSKISVADLLNLVKGDAEKYIPKPATEVYSYDDSDYDRLDAELESESQRWRTTWLKDQLGEEGYQKYRENRAQREAEQKAEQRLKDREQRKVETNRRKLQRESRESTIDAAMNKKLQEGAKPTEAKKELRRSILDMFSIPAGSRTEAVQIIDGYADRIIKNGVLTEADRKAFFDRMYAAGVMTVPADEYMALGRDAIYKGKIYVSESLRQELGDDWAELRRRAFGAGVYLTTDQQEAGVDVWNDDLAGILPGLFDSEMTDQRQILERIVQVAEEGRDEKVSLAEYTAQLAGAYYVSEDEVLDGMERDLDTALRIFAKTAGIEIKVKEQAIRNQTALTKENMRQRLQAAQERQDRKEMAQRQQEQKQLKEMQQKTLKTLQWLSKNRNRAPEELKAAFDEVLSDIDIYAVGAANEMRWSDKYNATWKDLAQMYVQAKETDPNFLPSKELEIIVSRLNDRKIEDLDISALNDLYKAAVGLRTEFYNRNNVMGDEMNRLFAEVYADSKEEITAAKGRKMGGVNDLFNKDQLSAMNVLQRMGGWNPNGAFYSMAKMLERGERDVRAFTVKANRALEQFLTENESWVKKADGQGKDAVWYTIEVPELLQLGMGDKPIFGDTVTVHMTPAQKVHMYLESKNVDNLRHMAGGRTFANRELYSKGKRQEAFAQGKTIRLAPETVKKIVSDLTAEELELAGILEQYYNSFAKGEINRVSNILYGYDKAMGSFYAPIFTNQNYVQSKIGIFDQTAEGVSNLKARQVAKNPSYQISAFDAFERNVDQTARFVGMAIPARNWNSLLSWQERGNSMKDVISHEWGYAANEYIENLIKELQGGKAEQQDVVSGWAGKLLSNYISSVFGFNPGIVLKQLGSIPMASAYLGASNVPSIQQVHDIDRTLIAKYTQDLDWRSMGYSMPETKQLKDNPNWTQTNKTARFLIGGGAITAMDTWAASTLWPWAENKVSKEHPELERGTQAQIDAGQSPFYKKVAEEFENAVARSQSVADIMHQSTIRKSKRAIVRTFTMFRSDSAQTYNALRQKIGEAQYLKKNGADSKQIQQANQAVGSVFLAALGNFMLAELVNLLMNLWKKKGKSYRDEEGEITFKSIVEKTGKGILKSMAGIVVGGEELAEAIGSMLTGERWYGVESLQIEVIDDVIQVLVDAGSFMKRIVDEGTSVVKNGGDLGAYLSRNSSDILGMVKDTAKELSGYLGGVPAGNIEAYMIGLLKDTIPGFEAAYDDTFSTVSKGSLAGMEGKSLELRVGSILENRKVSGDPETAGALAKLYAEGYKEAVPSDTPTSVTVDGDEHKLSPYQKQAFEKSWSGIVGAELDGVVTSDEFRDAEPEKQEKMLKTLFTYATDQAKRELFPELEPSSRADDIAAFESVGLGMPEFLRCYAEYTAINAEDLKAKEKAVRFSRWVHEQGFTKQQINVITDNLAYFNMTPADAGKFESAVDSGLDIEDAYDLQEQMAELEPEEGKVQVSDAQRWRLCVDMSSEPYVQIAALRSYMSDAQIRKAEIACHFDIDLSDYVRLYEIRAEYDANGNKSYSQAEYKAAIDSLKLSKEHSGILWQLATGAKSAKNNPYSIEAGERVLKVLE